MLNEDERKLFLKTRERIWKHVEKMDYNEFVSECLDEAQKYQNIHPQAQIRVPLVMLHLTGWLNVVSLTVRHIAENAQEAGEENHSIKKEYRG